MNITSAEFVKGVVGEDRIFEMNKPHVAFVGRSNVGKSSLINSLANRKRLAYSSSSPGKTRELNFYLINKDIYFVDLPGYGYAKASRAEQEIIRSLIVWYLLEARVNSRVVVLIIDAKVGATPFDTETRDLLRSQKIDTIVVANKIDKVKAREREAQLAIIRQWAGNSSVIAYSTETREGRNELWGEIRKRTTH